MIMWKTRFKETDYYVTINTLFTVIKKKKFNVTMSSVIVWTQLTDSLLGYL